MPCPIIGRLDRTGREARDDERMRGAGISLGGAPLALLGFGHRSAPLLQQMPVVLYTPPRISAILEQLAQRIEAKRGLRGIAAGAGAARRDRTAHATLRSCGRHSIVGRPLAIERYTSRLRSDRCVLAEVGPSRRRVES